MSLFNKKTCCVCHREVNPKHMVKVVYSYASEGIEDSRTIYACRDCYNKAAWEKIHELAGAPCLLP